MSGNDLQMLNRINSIAKCVNEKRVEVGGIYFQSNGNIVFLTLMFVTFSLYFDFVQFYVYYRDGNSVQG